MAKLESICLGNDKKRLQSASGYLNNPYKNSQTALQQLTAGQISKLQLRWHPYALKEYRITVSCSDSWADTPWAKGYGDDSNCTIQLLKNRPPLMVVRSWEKKLFFCSAGATSDRSRQLRRQDRATPLTLWTLLSASTLSTWSSWVFDLGLCPLCNSSMVGSRCFYFASKRLIKIFWGFSLGFLVYSQLCIALVLYPKLATAITCRAQI